MKLGSITFTTDAVEIRNGWYSCGRRLLDGTTVYGTWLLDDDAHDGVVWIGFRGISGHLKPCPHRGEVHTSQDTLIKVSRRPKGAPAPICISCGTYFSITPKGPYGAWVWEAGVCHPDDGMALEWDRVMDATLESSRPIRVRIGSQEPGPIHTTPWLLIMSAEPGYRGGGTISIDGEHVIVHRGRRKNSPRGALGVGDVLVAQVAPGALIRYHASGRLYGARGDGCVQVTADQLVELDVDYVGEEIDGERYVP